jgi:hypothetical protein
VSRDVPRLARRMNLPRLLSWYFTGGVVVRCVAPLLTALAPLLTALPCHTCALSTYSGCLRINVKQWPPMQPVGFMVVLATNPYSVLLR